MRKFAFVTSTFLLLKVLGYSQDLPVPAASAVNPDQKAGDVFANMQGIRFRYCPPGSFSMGSNTGEKEEKPVHSVTITKGFWIGETEVTQGQYLTVTGANPSVGEVGPGFPVNNVSWNDVQTFIKKLNEKDGGILYRLPTEAEWEYACRAGTTEPIFGPLDEIGWYRGNAGKSAGFVRLEPEKVHPVGQKKSNAWGLHDTIGNVYEWCSDWFAPNYYQNSPTEDPKGPASGEFKVLRGSAFYRTKSFCSASDRSYRGGTDLRQRGIGFRIVRLVTHEK